MSRIAKKSDLEKNDLKNFTITLMEARTLKITKNDLKGIIEIKPNEKYKIRATTGNRKSVVFYGTLMNAIKRKEELNNESKTSKKEINNVGIMFNEGLDLYMDYLHERENRGNIDINTVYDHYKKINNYILDFFKEYKLIEIDSNVIEKFYDYTRTLPNKRNPNKNLSERTISNISKTLNAIFNFFVKKKIIPSNPCNDITNKPDPQKTKKELNYFKISEAKYALKCLNKYANIRLKCFMNIIFSLGCRREEVSGLRWCDIDFETGEVNFQFAQTSHVPISFLEEKIERNRKLNIKSNNSKDYNRIRTKKLKTYNSYRINYLSNSAINTLKNYYKFKLASGINIKPTDIIFTNYKIGTNIYNYDKIDLTNDNIPVDPSKLSAEWREFKKKYNIKNVDLHRIRHTVANILEKRGIPKKDIAKMLGNTERVLEEFYTHVDIDDLKNTRNIIENSLYNEIDYIDINIELIVKILNEYPINSLNDEEFKKLDLISNIPIDSNNYFSILKRIKDNILTNNGELNYFIDEDKNNLEIKIEAYKRFSEENSIKIHKEKDISINRDVFYF